MTCVTPRVRGFSGRSGRSRKSGTARIADYRCSTRPRLCATVTSMSVDLVMAPKQKRPAGQPCCEPVAHPLVDAATARDLTAVAKALADPVRVQLVDVLRRHAGEVCVCELTPLFEVSQSTVSHHLKVLRDA